jgi:phenylacetate-coenzyme A ligase PaaK-like adenylate-forming protein
MFQVLVDISLKSFVEKRDMRLCKNIYKKLTQRGPWYKKEKKEEKIRKMKIKNTHVLAKMF